MRALLGLLFLGTLFVMAASWQSRTTRSQHDARANQYNRSSDASFDEGWSNLLVGRHSGGEPIQVPEGYGDLGAGGQVVGNMPGGGRGAAPLTRPGGDRPAPGSSPGPSPGPSTPRIPPDRVYVVQNGDVLGSICQKHYERPPHQLVDLVAEYNDLSSPNAIREGLELRLPAEVVFFPER